MADTPPPPTTAAPTCAPADGGSPDITWINVAIAGSLILINVLISMAFNLKISTQIIIATCRCTVQITVMGLLLGPIFKSDNVYLVFGLSALLLVLATFETTYHKGKRRYAGMFWAILASMLVTCGIAAIFGTALAMNANPFWEASLFIPTFGMLLGNMMASVALAVNYCLDSVALHKDQTELRLAFGATWWEATRPMAVEALRLAMLPTLNAMSVMGLISIPGMMTGQILAGQDPQLASRYQLVLMFLVVASTGMATVLAVIITLLAIFDKNHRLCIDRVKEEEFIVYQWMERGWRAAVAWWRQGACTCCTRRRKWEGYSDEESSALITSSTGYPESSIAADTAADTGAASTGLPSERRSLLHRQGDPSQSDRLASYDSVK